jgi:hypothetical protein
VDLEALFLGLSRDVGPRVPPGPVSEVFRTVRRRRARRRAGAAVTALACLAAGAAVWAGVRDRDPGAGPPPAVVAAEPDTDRPHDRLDPGDLLTDGEMPSVDRVYGAWSAQADRAEELVPVCLDIPFSSFGAVEVVGRGSRGEVGESSGEQIIARFPDTASALRAEEAFTRAMPLCRPNPDTTVEGPSAPTSVPSPAGARPEARAWLMRTTYRADGTVTAFSEIGVVRDRNVVSILTVTWHPGEAEARRHVEFTRALDLVEAKIAG